MKRPYKKKPRTQIEAGKHQIHSLIEHAGKVFAEDKELANRYVVLARKIAMRFKIKIDPKLQRKFCKHCYKYLMPGVNLTVRTHEGKVVYTCAECGKFMRFQYR